MKRKKNASKKHQKIVGKCQILPLFDFSDQKLQNSNHKYDLKLTILVVLWRACYRKKAKKKSQAQKYYHPKIQRLGPREFEFSRSKFFLVKTKKNLVKTQQNKTKPIFLAVPLYNYYHNGQYSRYSFASKRLFFFSENV